MLTLRIFPSDWGSNIGITASEIKTNACYVVTWKIDAYRQGDILPSFWVERQIRLEK